MYCSLPSSPTAPPPVELVNHTQLTPLTPSTGVKRWREGARLGPVGHVAACESIGNSYTTPSIEQEVHFELLPYIYLFCYTVNKLFYENKHVLSFFLLGFFIRVTPFIPWTLRRK